jgi:hypothetical protein
MPYDYAVLDNGSGSSKRPPKAQRKFVAQYLKSKGMTASAAGSRSAKEKKVRAEARVAYRASKAPKKAAPRTSGVTADRRPENKAKVDKAERARQERMRPRVDREAQRQLKGRSQNKNYVRGKNR